jgi:hypothetical protein
MTTNDTPWIDDIARWFADRDNARRFAKVMGYTGCRELWLQAELAMWLEHHRGLAADGDWDTNLLIANYGRSDLGVRDDKGGLELALEVKVLGGDYQTKVLTGSAGTLKSFVAGLKERSWKVEPGDLDDFKGFSLLSDYRRLHTLPNAREKVLLLVVDNRKGADSGLGEALAKIELPSKQTRTQAIAKDLHARLWHL